MPPPPPTSTLFPYTTLFRSARSRRHVRFPGGDGGLRDAGDDGGEGQPADLTGSLVKALRLRSPELPLPPRSSHRQDGDRKSTRLNSSHVRISYAVFCLKKKR